VSSPQASYWRFLTLDTYTGRIWTTANLDASGGQTLQTGVLQSEPSIDPDVLPTDGRTLQQHFTFDHLAQPWLPAAPDPAEILVSGGAIRYDPRSAALVAPNGTYPGYQYDVVSLSVIPDPGELDQITSLAAPQAARYTRLPTDTPAQIGAIARQWTAGQSTVYRRILAIQEHLRSFTYDDAVQPGHSSSDILNFLTHLRRGYCEQFAGSMAVLLRALGIPARVAVGFTPGRFDTRNRLFHVSTLQAHAWVEVLFPRYGWLPFEPTPTRDNPVASTYTAPQPADLPGFCLNPGQGCPDQAGAGATAGANGTNGNSFTRRQSGIDELNERGHRHKGRVLESTPPRRSNKGPAIKALLALVGLLAVSIPAAKLIRRRLTLRRAHGGRDRILAAYIVLTKEAADLGLGQRPAETLWEYAERLRHRVAFSNGDLERLATLTGLAAYSPSEPTSSQAGQAREAARTVLSDMRRATPATRRMLGWFRIERFSSEG
jgi:transglutaminase-like putative cysteine protease